MRLLLSYSKELGVIRDDAIIALCLHCTVHRCNEQLQGSNGR